MFALLPLLRRATPDLSILFARAGCEWQGLVLFWLALSMSLTPYAV